MTQISYEDHRQAVAAVFDVVGVQLAAITHAFRRGGAQQLDQAGYVSCHSC